MVDEVLEVESEEPSTATQETPEDVVTDEAEEIVEEEDVVYFGDKPPEVEVEQHSNPELVTELRGLLREQKRENKKLRKAQVKPEETAPLRARPTLKDLDYNEDKYDKDLDAWYGEKAAHDQTEATAKAEADERNNAFQERRGQYEESRKSFDPSKIADAESIVMEKFSPMQQDVLVEALGERAAPLIVGLSSSTKHLDELASEKSLIRFAVKLARLEADMKVAPRKRPKTSPETRVTGSAPSQAGDTTLEKLRDEAARTGDSTKVLAYKRQQRAAS